MKAKAKPKTQLGARETTPVYGAEIELAALRRLGPAGRRKAALERYEVARRQKLLYAETGFLAWFSRAEDVIIKKLEYFQEGGSDQHLPDIRAMLRVSGDEMDLAYWKRWIKKLELDTEWKIVKGSKAC